MNVLRRDVLRLFAIAACTPAWSAAWAAPRDGGRRFVAAWQDGGKPRAGLLVFDPVAGCLRDGGSFALPTRAHGFACDAAGRFIAVARRPGDWLLRWDGSGREPQWHWIEPARAFNGHVLADPGGRILYTTETDLETGEGLVGVRDAATLKKTGEWRTRGLDPHQLLIDDAAGALIVANGGILTLPETGRVKHQLDRMDSSLVRLDARSGALLGQWRLADQRLSLRHLAWSADHGTLGVALQAEHENAEERARAPLLALFDGRQLSVFGAPRPLGGYGGDIAASAAGFSVSCTRADGVAHFGGDGRWLGFSKLPDAGALAVTDGALWAGGLERAVVFAEGMPGATSITGPRLDNHWLPVTPVAAKTGLPRRT